MTKQTSPKVDLLSTNQQIELAFASQVNNEPSSATSESMWKNIMQSFNMCILMATEETLSTDEDSVTSQKLQRKQVSGSCICLLQLLQLQTQT